MTLFPSEPKRKSYERICVRIWFQRNWNWAPFICATFFCKPFESYHFFLLHVRRSLCSSSIFCSPFIRALHILSSSPEHLLHLLFIFHLILFVSQMRIFSSFFFFISSVCLLTTVIVNLYLTLGVCVCERLSLPLSPFGRLRSFRVTSHPDLRVTCICMHSLAPSAKVI